MVPKMLNEKVGATMSDLYLAPLDRSPMIPLGVEEGWLVKVKPVNTFLCEEHHATGSNNRCRMAKFGFVDSPCLMKRVAIVRLEGNDE